MSARALGWPARPDGRPKSGVGSNIAHRALTVDEPTQASVMRLRSVGVRPHAVTKRSISADAITSLTKLRLLSRQSSATKEAIKPPTTMRATPTICARLTSERGLDGRARSESVRWQPSERAN